MKVKNTEEKKNHFHFVFIHLCTVDRIAHRVRHPPSAMCPCPSFADSPGISAIFDIHWHSESVCVSVRRCSLHFVLFLSLFSSLLIKFVISLSLCSSILSFLMIAHSSWLQFLIATEEQEARKYEMLQSDRSAIVRAVYWNRLPILDGIGWNLWRQ